MTPRWITILACSTALLAQAHPAPSQSASQSAAPPAQKSAAAVAAPVTIDLPHAPRPLLPAAFAGWKTVAPAKTITDPAQFDSANAAALKEYDFNRAVIADYKRNGETLGVRALSFNDATGAYGAYSYLRQNGWPRQEIGEGGAADRNRVLFWNGTTVIDATFSRPGARSAADLRELAKLLPMPQGNRSIAPPILADLPQTALEKQTTHYALGPAGYTGAGGVLPADLIGFDRGAESVTAEYGLPSGRATLTVIDFPTPQMAAAAEAKIGAYIKAGSQVGTQAQPAWPKALADSNSASLEVRRSGPLVAFISGNAAPGDAHKLLGSVHFGGDVATIPLPTESEISKTSRLLMGIAELVIVGSSAAILLGFFLGGGRALYRIARGKPASSVYETEFIRLNLEK